jgi:undecaprenyl-diphosphatase
MFAETLNQAAFAALNWSNASPGAIASLEALAVVPVWLLPPLLTGIWLIGDRADRAAAVMAGLAACVALAIAHLASLTIDHPRPFMIGLAPNILAHAADSSFPSDHATTFFALAFAFARRPVSALPGLAWVLGALGLVVGLARVALGLHFPLDIGGGVAIGGVGAAIAGTALQKPGALLALTGERLRGFIAPLAKRDGRERTRAAHARPAR